MTYSDEALAFSQIPVSDQVRVEDRVSYLYLEYCLIRQDRTGVVAIGRRRTEQDEPKKDPEKVPPAARIQLPVAGIGVLLLGPGTSISNPAATSCARSGVTVIFTSGGGIGCYSLATPLTSSARWAIAQARLVSNEARARDAARILYRKQLGIEDLDVTSIAAMRGIEGRTIRNLYKKLAQKHNVLNFKRDTNSEDPINQGLNLANSILYGCAATACGALGVNPALGIIHRGNVRSLLFDLADLYKPVLSIPVAFESAHHEDFLEQVRRKVRSHIHRQKVLKEMVQILIEILSPHLPSRDDDRLVGGNNREVAGHRQYRTAENCESGED